VLFVCLCVCASVCMCLRRRCFVPVLTITVGGGWLLCVVQTFLWGADRGISTFAVNHVTNLVAYVTKVTPNSNSEHCPSHVHLTVRPAYRKLLPRTENVRNGERLRLFNERNLCTTETSCFTRYISRLFSYDILSSEMY
jgi:hypothetical protein